MQESSIERKIIAELSAYAEEEKAAYLPHFFQAFEGGCGEGDRFLGVRVPNTRKIAKLHACLRLEAIGELLRSQWHEVRLCALFIPVERYRRDGNKQIVVRFYLSHLEGVNNWDLVDSSCYQILGDSLSRPRSVRSSTNSPTPSVSPNGFTKTPIR